MLINIETKTTYKIEKLEDLKNLRCFVENNDIKINKSEIARYLKVDRRTVDKYLKGFSKNKKRNKPSKLDKYKEIINELLSSPYQKFSYKICLYRYLCDNYNMDVTFQSFYHFLRKNKEFDNYFKKENSKSYSNSPVIRYETLPGKQAQIDWKESIPFILADTGEIIKIHVLVFIMGDSRFRIYKPSLFMNQEVLLHLLTEIFESIGGVPETILSDNMKTIMDIPRSNYKRGKVNYKFEIFSKDMGFELIPCCARSPKTKGKVESQMKYLEEIRAYSGKLDLMELYELIDRINLRVNNSICQGTGKIPMLEFEKEKNSLLSLPPESIRNQYKIKTKKVKVNTAAMITIKSNQYSVPCEYIGENVDYQIHGNNVYIYFNTKLISTHQLSTRKLNYSLKDYNNVLKENYKNKDIDEIEELAKNNLKIIGDKFE